ncbi:DMT family transporter [Brevibacillus sp. SYSU BS000544]|uniref:DMT family transporter n=1 Tax=Brevibacillus sp. SYSU BS000544 TaxID=3416443 RepID=UPI003CE5740D
MNSYVVSLLLAFGAGLFLSVQGAINSFIGKTTGQYVMIIGVSIFQVIFASFFLLRAGGSLPINIIPWLAIAGAMGVGIMYSISASVGNIGTLLVFVLLILGQIFASSFIDHFGALGTPKQPLNLHKIGSLLVILAGVFWLVKSS